MNLNTKQYFEIQRAEIDEKKRTMRVSFSSETPINKGYYTTLLMHDDDSVDLSLLNAGASVLFNHDENIIIGKTSNAAIEDRRGRVDITFDTDEEAEKLFQKVIGGSLKGISVGGNPVTQDDVLYIEQGNFEYRDGKFIAGPAKIYTHWIAHEISLTPIPADTSVGVNQSQKGEESMNLDDVIKGLGKSDELKDLIKQAVEASIAPAVEAAIKQAMSKTDDKTEDKTEDKGLLKDSAELIKRAAIVSLECKSEVTDMVLDGKKDFEISDHIIKQAMSTKGTTMKDDDTKGEGFDIDDDVFTNGFKS